MSEQMNVPSTVYAVLEKRETEYAHPADTLGIKRLSTEAPVGTDPYLKIDMDQNQPVSVQRIEADKEGKAQVVATKDIRIFSERFRTTVQNALVGDTNGEVRAEGFSGADSPRQEAVSRLENRLRQLLAA